MGNDGIKRELLSPVDHEVIQLRKEVDALHESVDLLTEEVKRLIMAQAKT